MGGCVGVRVCVCMCSCVSSPKFAVSAECPIVRSWFCVCVCARARACAAVGLCERVRVHLRVVLCLVWSVKHQGAVSSKLWRSPCECGDDARD